MSHSDLVITSDCPVKSQKDSLGVKAEGFLLCKVNFAICEVKGQFLANLGKKSHNKYENGLLSLE
jgi:hypothetical protein